MAKVEEGIRKSIFVVYWKELGDDGAWGPWEEKLHFDSLKDANNFKREETSSNEEMIGKPNFYPNYKNHRYCIVRYSIREDKMVK